MTKAHPEGFSAGQGLSDVLSAPGLRVVAWLVVLTTLTGTGVVLTHLAGAEPAEEFPPAALLAAFAPLLAALGVAAFSPRLRGARVLLRQIGTWRAGPHWYALVILVPAALVIATNLISAALGGPAPATLFAIPTMVMVLGLLGPGLAGVMEEVAWRGFAQPLLQVRFNALTASIIIGIIWATWHEWPLLTPGGLDDFSLAWVLHGYVRFIATAVLYAWLYNTTRSLVLVMVAHLAHNAAVGLLPTPDALGSSWALIFAALYLLLAAVVVWCTDPRTLTR